MLVKQCALMRLFFGNNQGVCLLLHERELERIKIKLRSFTVFDVQKRPMMLCGK